MAHKVFQADKISMGDVIQISKNGAYGLVLNPMYKDESVTGFNVLPIVALDADKDHAPEDYPTMIPRDLKLSLGLDQSKKYIFSLSPRVALAQDCDQGFGLISVSAHLGDNKFHKRTLEKLSKLLAANTQEAPAEEMTGFGGKAFYLQYTSSGTGNVVDVSIEDAEKLGYINVDTASVLKHAKIERLLTARDIAKDPRTHLLRQIYMAKPDANSGLDNLRRDIISGAQKFLLERAESAQSFADKGITTEFAAKEKVSFSFRPLKKIDVEAARAVTPEKKQGDDVSATSSSDISIRSAQKLNYIMHSDTPHILKAANVKTLREAYALTQENGFKRLREAYKAVAFPFISMKELIEDISEGYNAFKANLANPDEFGRFPKGMLIPALK